MLHTHAKSLWPFIQVTYSTDEILVACGGNGMSCLPRFRLACFRENLHSHYSWWREVSFTMDWTEWNWMKWIPCSASDYGTWFLWGKQVIYQAMMALCQEGDEVIVPAPYWTSYPAPQLAILVCTRHVKCCHEALWRLQTIQTPEAAAAAYSKCALRNWLCPNDEDIVKLSGASPVIMETLASSGYAIDATKLAATITPKTRMLIDPWRTRVDRFDAKIANFSTLVHRLWRFHTCDRSQSTDEYWVQYATLRNSKISCEVCNPSNPTGGTDPAETFCKLGLCGMMWDVFSYIFMYFLL